jgi:hypothetical protein
MTQSAGSQSSPPASAPRYAGAREAGVVAAHLLKEALSILTTDERLDSIAERMVARRAYVDDRLGDHRGQRRRSNPLA